MDVTIENRVYEEQNEVLRLNAIVFAMAAMLTVFVSIRNV